MPTYQWREGILWIEIPTGEIVDSRNIDPRTFYTMDTQLLMHESGAQHQEKLEEEVYARLRPLLTKNLRYCPDECLYTEPVSPPSTGGWYTRLIHGRTPAIYIIQELDCQDLQWLTIIDRTSGEVFESHPVHKYEGSALLPQPEEPSEFRYSSDIPTRDEVIGPLLQGSTPDITSLYELIRDAEIPHLRFGGFEPKESVRETLEQVVPESWSQNVREETMAFLSYVLSNPTPLGASVDSVSFSLRFMGSPQLRYMIMLHQLHLLSGHEENPRYLALMWQYEKLYPPKDSNEHNDGPNIAGFLYDKIARNAIYYDTHIQDYLSKMRKVKFIPAGIPVSKKDAGKSRQARLRRLMYFVGGLYVFGRVAHRRVGLRNMVYVGQKYRWPHQHIEYTQVLNDTMKQSRPTMIHSIAVPPDAEEVLLEERTRWLPVSWYVRRTNPRLFSAQDAEARINYEQLLASLESQYNLQAFERRYGIRGVVSSYNDLNRDDIRVMDLLSTYLYLFDIEFPSFVKSLGFGNVEQITSSVEKLTTNNVLSLTYDLSPRRYETLAILARGNEGSILSLFRALLQKTPRCTCLSLDSGRQYLAFVRSSRYMGEVFRELLPAWAEENGVKLTCSFSSTTGNYRSNLFQRLRKEDGTWDSDITGLLAQIGK